MADEREQPKVEIVDVELQRAAKSLAEFVAKATEKDRRSRHAAVRKLVIATWAYDEDDESDARRGLKRAASHVLDMEESSVVALTAIAKMLGDVNAMDGCDPTEAMAALVLPGETVLRMPNPERG